STFPSGNASLGPPLKKKNLTGAPIAPARGAPCGPPFQAPRGPSRPLVDPSPPLRGPVAAPSGPVAAPNGPVAASSDPVAAPSGPVAAPSGPVAAPSGPDATPQRDMLPLAARTLPLPAPSTPSSPAAESPNSRATEPPSSRAAEPPCRRAATVPTGAHRPYFLGLGRAVDFEVWVDDLQLFLQCDRANGLSLFDLTSGASPAPPATADCTVRSQWAIRDAAARLAVRRHLPTTERAHFSQYKSAQTLYDAVVARYSSPATAALSRLTLPYLFSDLAAFPTVADLITHLRTSDTRYRTALPA
ncbi:unnamed protein product, partial [Closterium sp. NIES-54]